MRTCFASQQHTTVLSRLCNMLLAAFQQIFLVFCTYLFQSGSTYVKPARQSMTKMINSTFLHVSSTFHRRKCFVFVIFSVFCTCSTWRTTRWHPVTGLSDRQQFSAQVAYHIVISCHTVQQFHLAAHILRDFILKFIYYAALCHFVVGGLLHVQWFFSRTRHFSIFMQLTFTYR